ncbi:hypothetical protein BJX64DRAFT_267012 [Aspergillus heterothallicus]
MENVSTINVNRLFLEICGLTLNDDSTSSIWHYTHDPERFAFTNSSLQEYVAGFTNTSDVADLCARARIDAVLVMSLAFAKRKLLNSLGTQQSTAARHRLRTLFWSHEQIIELSSLSPNPWDIETAAIDYVLWCEDPRALATNLVVLRLDEPLDSTDWRGHYLPALVATSIIHHTRSTESPIRETYGIATDGLKWIFLNINEDQKCSCLQLNWLDGQQQIIVGLIGRILDQAISVKMNCEESEMNAPGWSPEWNKAVKTWDAQPWDYSDQDETYDPNIEEDRYAKEAQAFRQTVTMHWLDRLQEKCLAALERANRGQKVDKGEMNADFAAARVESTQEKKQAKQKATKEKPSKEKPLPTIAVTEIPKQDVYQLLGLQTGKPLSPHFSIAPGENRTLSPHLAKTMENIDLVYGKADPNEAVIRLKVDAILLEVLATIKRLELGQWGNEKSLAKRMSSETTIEGKSLQMALETPISYPMTLRYEKGPRRVEVRGRMDYCLWYGKPCEAETNLMVVEAKTLGKASEGEYQALCYMSMIQDARRKAKRTLTPLWGIATDSRHWEFLRLDTNGKVSAHTLRWNYDQQDEILSLLYKIAREASTLSPVNSLDLHRHETVEDVTGYCPREKPDTGNRA